MGMAQTGEHGLAAARRLRAGGGITGLVMVAWLVEQEAIDADAVTPEEATVGVTDHFAALHELDSFRSPRFTCSRRSHPSGLELLGDRHRPPREEARQAGLEGPAEAAHGRQQGQPRHCGWLRGRRQYYR
jgi:hypothetical protein